MGLGWSISRESGFIQITGKEGHVNSFFRELWIFCEMASELDKESVSFLKVLRCVASEPLVSFLYPRTWKSIGVSRTLNDFVTSFFGLLENISLLIYIRLPNDDSFIMQCWNPCLLMAPPFSLEQPKNWEAKPRWWMPVSQSCNHHLKLSIYH